MPSRTPAPARWTPRPPLWRRHFATPTSRSSPARMSAIWKLAPDGRTIVAVHYRHNGQSTKVSPKLVILSAGAIMSSVILQRSPSPQGKRPRQQLRPGRPQLHESQFGGDAGHRSAPPQRQRLPEDADAERLLPVGRQRRNAARQRPASRQGRRQRARRPTSSLRRASRSTGWRGIRSTGLSSSEDLPDPESRVMVDGERDRAAVAALEHAGAPTS